MFNTGRCSNSDCQKTIAEVLSEAVTVRTGLQPESWIGLVLLCPHCRTVLGASIDPIALKADIVNEIAGG